MAYDPSTDTLYASAWNGDSSGGSALFQVDRNNGSLSIIGEAPLTPYAMTWDQNRDRLLFSSATIPSQFGWYDTSSGAQTVISTFDSMRMSGLAYDATGDAVFAVSGDTDLDGRGDRLFRIDPETGAATLVTTLSAEQRYGSLVSVPIPTPSTAFIFGVVLCTRGVRRSGYRGLGV